MEITCSDFYSNPDGKISVTSSFEAETIFFRLDNESKINVTIDSGIFSSLNDNLYTGKQFKDVKLKKKAKNYTQRRNSKPNKSQYSNKSIAAKAKCHECSASDSVLDKSISEVLR